MSHASESNLKRPVAHAVPVLEVEAAEPAADVLAAEIQEAAEATPQRLLLEKAKAEPEPVQEVRPAPVGVAVPMATPAPLKPALQGDWVLPPADARMPAVIRIIFQVSEWLFGFVSILGALAILAALPVLQFLSLGYLLEAGGRIARTGRFREGFIGFRLAARIGTMVLCCWLWLLPVRLVADMANAAEIIDPGGPAANGWRLALFILMGLTFIHIVAACARAVHLLGQKEPWHFILTWLFFIWPFNVTWLACRIFRGGYYSEARDAVWNTVFSLRLPYYFWLGLRGFIAAFAWLVVPITMIAASRGNSNGAMLIGFLGAFLLAIILLYLPFLQLRLAATNRLRGGFELLAVREGYCLAPWAFTTAFILTLLFALPLYLLKIQIVPREAAWLPSLVFIFFIFPARLLTGWAMGRAHRRQAPRHWFFRWTGRLPLLPVAGFYVLIVFFTQYTSWHGVWSLYEQHAFLVPVPFLSM
ncbi:MAG TPA: hypothetical protein VKS79_26835 [Gemmataceae bacterium]|nr:hypothetical protein [Gemmataceae bacterium]